MSPSGGDRRKGAGGPERSRNPPAPSSFWGQSILTPTCGRRPYATTNSGPAATARRSMPPRPSRPLPPPPLPLDHSPQRLTARRAAKPLARAPLRGGEVLFTPRTVAAKKSGIVGWALALGRRLRTGTRGVRPRGVGRLGFGGTPSLGAATPITPALRLAFLLAVGGPPILPAGLSSPPPPCRRAALGATVPGLGVGRSKGFLTSLEQTPPLSRPTSPLTSPRFVASWSGPKEAANFRRPSLGRGVPYAPPRGAFLDPFSPRGRSSSPA